MSKRKRDEAVPEPDTEAGIDYWASQPASYDGVLGGFGTGSLPRVDALGSRQFLLNLIPELSTVPSAIRPLDVPATSNRRYRAVDVGAGVGRVTSDVLLYLVHDVVLVEPVESLVHEAWARGRANTAGLPAQRADGQNTRWKGIADKSTSVTFAQGTLQAFDPVHPLRSTKVLGRVGYASESDADDAEEGFDVVWCQWCLGHLSDVDLVDFFRRAKASLRDAQSLIVVKENLCTDTEDGGPLSIYDEQDSSLTRSDAAWKKLYKEAGLRLVQERVQLGFPEGLYAVKMYALR